MSYDSDARRCFGVSLRTLTARIGRRIDAATPSDLEAAARWYDDAHTLAVTLSGVSGYDVETCAAVIAAHSPRTLWSVNVAAATTHLTNPAEIEGLGLLGANIDRAVDVMVGEPLRGPKTRRFAANIAGDHESVTIDIWMVRGFGVTEKELARKGAYDVLEHAVQTASRARGLEPATGQAAAWIVVRGGAS